MKLHYLLASAAALCIASGAHAASIDYNLTGPIVATFSVDTTASKCSVTPIAFSFCGISATINGAAFNNATVTFGESTFGGGFTLGNASGTVRYNLDGPQLFSGTPASPTPLTGNFGLTGGFNTTAGSYSLTANTVAAAPEPATWAMMIVGFGLVGGSLRRRQQQAALRFA